MFDMTRRRGVLSPTTGAWLYKDGFCDDHRRGGNGEQQFWLVYVCRCGLARLLRLMKHTPTDAEEGHGWCV